MEKNKHIKEQSENTFNWEMYEDGYTGGYSLKVNKKVKTTGRRDKVYSHEPYAQETYDKMWNKSNGQVYTHKDEIVGNIYNITDVQAKSDHELVLDANNGASVIIDLNKERQYLEMVGATAQQFTEALRTNSSFKKELLDSGLRVKVIGKDKMSLWEGRKSYVEEELAKQYNSKSSKYAYTAKVLEINNGGYIVDIMGLRCFLPGSLAAAGIITNFEELLGKELPVMVVNYIAKTKCWVVSHKKYIETILPNKIENELTVGQAVDCKVSGTSKNGIFVSFKDSEGEWIFSGLCHRSVMSSALQELFDTKNIMINDQLHLYITAINYVDDKPRVVLGDRPISELKEEDLKEISE